MAAPPPTLPDTTLISQVAQQQLMANAALTFVQAQAQQLSKVTNPAAFAANMTQVVQSFTGLSAAAASLQSLATLASGLSMPAGTDSATVTANATSILTALGGWQTSMTNAFVSISNLIAIGNGTPMPSVADLTAELQAVMAAVANTSSALAGAASPSPSS